MRHTLFYLLLAAVLLTGCKYEDGPLVSIRSPKGRMVGSKQITSYVVNGVDSTFLFDSLYVGTEYLDKGMFFDLHDLNDNLWISECAPGMWGFHDSDNYILYLVLPSCNGRQFWRYQEWRVLKLTSKNLWLESAISGDNTTLRFQRN